MRFTQDQMPLISSFGAVSLAPSPSLDFLEFYSASATDNKKLSILDLLGFGGDFQWYSDDFNNPVAAIAANVTAGGFAPGIYVTTSGTASSATTSAAGSIVTLATGTTTTGNANMFCGRTIDCNNNTFATSCILQVPTLTTTGQTFNVFFGLGLSCYFSLAAAGGNWVANPFAGSPVTTSVAATAGAYVRLAIKKTSISTVDMLINGTVVASGNIPVNTQVQPTLTISKATGTTSRTVVVDRIDAFESWTTATRV